MSKVVLVILGILIILIVGIFAIGYFASKEIEKEIPPIVKAPVSEEYSLPKVKSPEKTLKESGELSKTNFLEELKNKGKICKILKEKQKEIFLFCNNRPFYLKTEDEKLKYEINGWSFLKEDLSLWNDLENCEFYESEKIDDTNYNLVFYCPKDLDFQEITAKEYNYNLETLKMTKIGEKDFLDIIAEKVKNKYEFLKECSVKTEINTERSEKPIILTFDCNGEKVISSVLLESQYLSLPFFDKKDLEQKEKIKFSFEKVLGDKCEIENIESDTIYAKCSNFIVGIKYTFEPFYLTEYKFQVKEMNKKIGVLFINDFGNYFTLTKTENPVFMNQYKKPSLVNDFMRYQINRDCIILISSKNSIDGLIKESEKIWK